MKGYRYCYAHERMLQTQSQKLELPALEDANGIQMAIMRVQKALIDDEISEKKAGLLLYSLQMASSNLKHTTFTDSKKEVVTEMPEAAVSTQQYQHSGQRGNNFYRGLTRMNADRSRQPAGKKIRDCCRRAKIAKIARQDQNLHHRGRRGTQRQGQATAGGCHPIRPKAGLPRNPGLCHTSIGWGKFPVSPQR